MMRPVVRPAARLCVLLASIAPAFGQTPPAEHTETWPDGTLRERYSVDADGNRHGIHEVFAPNGTKTLSETLVHGHKDGPYREWREDGRPFCALNYRNDVLHGLCRTFHDNGEPATTGNYDAGVRTGRWTETDAGGERTRIAEFRNGELHGQVRVLQKSRVLSRQVWKSGELVNLDGLEPFPVARDALLRELRGILGTEVLADPKDPKAGLRQAALLRLRAYRQLCGLPQREMQLSTQWSELCDAAAEVCRRNGNIDHHPPQPPGVDDAQYKAAQQGASHSNLAIGGSVVDSVDSYMDDSDPSNIERIGHRRWCLNPLMKKTGFGTDGSFHAMWSMDESGKLPHGFDATYYPPRGWVPVDLFEAHRAFSIASSKGGAPKADDLRAVVRPLDDDWLPGEPLAIDSLHAAPPGYGTGTCIVFRAAAIDVQPGKRYSVEVSVDGGKTLAHRYVVAFCEPVLAAK